MVELYKGRFQGSGVGECNVGGEFCFLTMDEVEDTL